MKKICTLCGIFLMLSIFTFASKVSSSECGKIYTFDPTKRKPKKADGTRRPFFPGNNTPKIIPIKTTTETISEESKNLDRINNTIFNLSPKFPRHFQIDQSQSRKIMYDLMRALSTEMDTYKRFPQEVSYFILSFFSFEMREINIFPKYWDYILASYLVAYKNELEQAGRIAQEILTDTTVWINKPLRSFEVGEEDLLLISSRVTTILQTIAESNLKEPNRSNSLVRIDTSTHSYSLLVSLDKDDQEQALFHEKEKELPLPGEVISQFPQNYVSKVLGFNETMLAGIYISPTLNKAYFIIYDIKKERILFRNEMTIVRNQFDMSVVFNDRNEFLTFTTPQGFLEQWAMEGYVVSTKWKKSLGLYGDIQKKITTKDDYVKACFDSKGTMLVIAGDKGVLFWEIEKNREIDFIPLPVIAKVLHITNDRELNVVSEEGPRFNLDIHAIIQSVHTSRSYFEM